MRGMVHTGTFNEVNNRVDVTRSVTASNVCDLWCQGLGLCECAVIGATIIIKQN